MYLIKNGAMYVNDQGELVADKRDAMRVTDDFAAKVKTLRLLADSDTRLVHLKNSAAQ